MYEIKQMSDWKNFPCQECLIKKVCNKVCFKLPPKSIPMLMLCRQRALKDDKCMACGGTLIRIINHKIHYHNKCKECNGLEKLLLHAAYNTD